MRQSAARTGVLMDPSSLWSDALESILPRIGIEVRGKATSADEALTLIGLHQPDLLIVDLGDKGEFGEQAFFDEARRRAPFAQDHRALGLLRPGADHPRSGRGRFCVRHEACAGRGLRDSSPAVIRAIRVPARKR